MLKSPVPLRTMSSGVLNSGLGWYKYFINRHVDVKYNVRDYKQDMRAYLQKYNMQESETVAMMTAVNLKNVGIVEIKEKDYSLMIVATAGVRNAIIFFFYFNNPDVFRSEEHTSELQSRGHLVC